MTPLYWILCGAVLILLWEAAVIVGFAIWWRWKDRRAGLLITSFPALIAREQDGRRGPA